MKHKNKSGKSKKVLKTTFITLATIAVMLICIFVIWLTTGVDFGMVDTVKNITLKINTTVYSTNADGKDEVFEQIIASENPRVGEHRGHSAGNAERNRRHRGRAIL